MTLPRAKRSDGRLKRFSSILDDRVWSLEEYQRYRYLYDLMSGSQTCLPQFSSFKYVPLEALVKLLLAERDAYIKCLEERLGIKKDTGAGSSGVTTAQPSAAKPAIPAPVVSPQKQQPSSPVATPVKEIFKAGTFIDDEEQDPIVMKNKIASLTAELEECRCARDTLREAMHKLENIDEIVNENESLKDRLRCSEEMIKYLEEKKSKLEKELENLRTKSQIQMDLQEAQEMLLEVGEREKKSQKGDLSQLAEERDYLQKRVEELQMELKQAKSRQSEMELLRKQSESASLSLEELTRENELYKKKLASMKDLEKQIEELKKRANQIADKHKRDSIKACDQDKRMEDLCRQLKSLREERDRLRRRVEELTLYEQQYNSLQSKLKQVDQILAENAMLNCKLAGLDKLEMENRLLRSQLEQTQASEMEAAESKEKITELQNAVADQEEEMKDLLCQIERLTRTYGDSSELDRLKEELCNKECKLRLCEEQLAEIPILEAEVDELRSKLENCYNNITGYPSSTDEKTTVIDAKYEERVAFEGRTAEYSDIPTERIQILEKMDSEKTMTCEEVQDLLQSSKGVINCVLQDMVEHQKEMEELEKCNREMKDEISMLKARMGKTDMDEFFEEMKDLKRLIQEKEKRICCLERQIARSGDLGKVNDHISNLEREIECLKDLNRKMRSDLQEACCEVQRCAELECLLEEEKRARCAAEAAAKQGESRTKSQKEVFNLEAKESLTNDVDALKSRIENLNKLVEELEGENAMLKKGQQENLDYQENTEEREALENLLNCLQRELDACRNEKDTDEMKALRCELDRLRDHNCQLRSLVNCYKERLELERCSKSSRGSSAGVEQENRKLKADLARLQNELMDVCNRLDDCSRRHREKSSEFDQLLQCYQKLLEKNDEMEKELQSVRGQRPSRSEVGKKSYAASKVHEGQVPEANEPEVGADYAKDLEDRKAMESAMRNVEEEVDGLTTKFEERGKVEQERDNLLKKQADMEYEMEKLRKELEGCRKSCQEGQSKPREEPSSKQESENTQLTQEKLKAKEETSRKQEPESKQPTPEDKRIAKQEPESDKSDSGEKSKLKEEASRKQELESKKSDPEEKSKPKEETSRKQESESKKSDDEEKAKAKEEKLLEEMVGMRKQAEEAKAENKKLKEDLDKLKKLLEECNKAKSNEEAQASLMSSRQEGTSYPVQPAPKAVPQTVIPIEEAQTASVLERGRQEQMQKPETASVIETPLNETKVVVEPRPKPGTPPCPGGGSSDESIISFSNLDPGFSKFICTLNPLDHRQNVCQIEARYREMMMDLKQKNEEKVKKLMDQHKKESAMKDRAFNENMTTVRSGYESDIRKLVDRHKESILRLQNLHEDEIQGLNANYEKELEAMQTQNENVVNDLTSGAAEKFKSLAERHNRDLKEIETKYQKMLEKKEEDYAKSTQEGNAGDVGSQYERELKRLKRSNLKRVEIMQQKYEKLLASERKKYQKQLEEAVNNLKKGKGIGDGICQCRFPVCGDKDPDAPLEFNDVLQKILAFGLESLTFNELALVHRRTCAATGDIVLNPEMKAHLLPAIAIASTDDRDVLMKENKKELLNRILVVENEIAIKQMETQEAIVNMELAVKAERQRLQDLRDSLRQEQEKNSDLKSKLSRTTAMSLAGTSPTVSTPRRTPPDRCDQKFVYQVQCMPPIKIEDIVSGPRPIPKPATGERGISDRAEDIIHKIEGLQKNRSVYTIVEAEKDTTKAKHKKTSAKDTKTKNKVTPKKKGKK